MPKAVIAIAIYSFAAAISSKIDEHLAYDPSTEKA
jgi:hypothetical protein